MKKLVFLAAFLLLSSVAFADKNITEEDGNKWNELAEVAGAKTFYVAGFMTGAENAAENLYGVSSFFFTPIPNCEKSKNRQIHDKWFKNIKMESSDKGFSVDEMKYVFWCLVDPEGEANRYKIPNITVGQMVDGLDALYADFKNRSILLTDAVYFVKKQINGLSSDDGEKLLLYLRGGKKLDDLKLLVIKDSEGIFVRSISFP